MSHDTSPLLSRGARRRARTVSAKLVHVFSAVALMTGITVAAVAIPSGAAAAAEAHHAAPAVSPSRAANLAPRGTRTSPPFDECPPIFGDTSGCALLIVVTDHGVSILQDTSEGGYDTDAGAEDTLVGVLNQSSRPLYRLQLTSRADPIFGFDGDGICTYATGGSDGNTSGFPGDGYCNPSQLQGEDPPGGNGDPLGSDYQGPQNTFANISADAMSGDVVFGPPLATGAGTYFSLEEPLTTNSFGVQSGYWQVASDGGIFAYDAPYFGSMGGLPLNKPIVAIAADPVTGGYWEVASDGGLFSFGAPFFGSMGGKPLNQPIVGMVATPDGGGYWEVASDGGLFAFGDANFFGSMGGKPLNKPVVGIATTLDGQGYFEVASDGGLFAFGDAVFQGSMGGQPLNQPIVGMTFDPGTGGYWEVASDGGLFSFNAPFLGSMGGTPLNKPIVGMAATPDGQGYWETASDGGIFNFGDAVFWGSQGGQPLNAPVVGIAASG
jgi:hypothetical protein